MKQQQKNMGDLQIVLPLPVPPAAIKAAVPAQISAIASSEGTKTSVKSISMRRFRKRAHNFSEAYVQTTLLLEVVVCINLPCRVFSFESRRPHFHVLYILYPQMAGRGQIVWPILVPLENPYAFFIPVN